MSMFDSIDPNSLTPEQYKRLLQRKELAKKTDEIVKKKIESLTTSLSIPGLNPAQREEYERQIQHLKGAGRAEIYEWEERKIEGTDKLTQPEYELYKQGMSVEEINLTREERKNERYAAEEKQRMEKIREREKEESFEKPTKIEGINYEGLTGRKTTSDPDEYDARDTDSQFLGINPFTGDLLENPNYRKKSIEEIVKGESDVWAGRPGMSDVSSVSGLQMTKKESDVSSVDMIPTTSGLNAKDLPKTEKQIENNQIKSFQDTAAEMADLAAKIQSAEAEQLAKLGTGFQFGSQNKPQNSVNTVSQGGNSTSVVSSGGSDYFKRMKDESLGLPRWRLKLG